jgi:hypothetical protein
VCWGAYGCGERLKIVVFDEEFVKLERISRVRDRVLRSRKLEEVFVEEQRLSLETSMIRETDAIRLVCFYCFSFFSDFVLLFSTLSKLS